MSLAPHARRTVRLLTVTHRIATKLLLSPRRLPASKEVIKDLQGRRESPIDLKEHHINITLLTILRAPLGGSSTIEDLFIRLIRLIYYSRP